MNDTITNLFLDRINVQMKKRGWTIYKLAKESGIPYSSVNNFFVRNTIPTLNTIEKICNGLGITISDFFLTNEDSILPLTTEQRRFLNTLEQIPPAEYNVVMAYLDGILKKSKPTYTDVNNKHNKDRLSH